MNAASAVAATILLASFAAPAPGQALRDPTQPPMAAQPMPPAGASPESSGPVLQSIIVSEGRRLALIDGKTYQTGDKLGSATVASIAGNEVTLRGAEGTRVLKLYPDPNKSVLRERSTPGSSKERP